MDAERPEKPAKDSEEDWKQILSGAHPGYRWGRNLFRRLPSTPRCKLCAAPFAGSGGRVMRLIGKKPWPKNPKYCGSCLSELNKHHGGAEIECTLLFADVRGSTSMAEQMRPTEFRELMDRFYETATNVLIDHDAFVDKFVGDEVIGMFIPMLTGELHASRGIEAARALIAATAGRDGAVGLPIGAGVHTGVSFVGTVGSGDDLNFTALGDAVNTTARLASAAKAGEILVTLAAAAAAKLDITGLERRDLKLKGKTEAVSVVVLTA
jgi:adenylate cyclase